MLHHLGPILLPDNMGIIVKEGQDDLQGGAGQRKGQKLFWARRWFTPLLKIRSLMSISPKAKAKVQQIVRITVLQKKGTKMVLHHLGPILLPVNMGIIEEVVQDILQE